MHQSIFLITVIKIANGHYALALPKAAQMRQNPIMKFVRLVEAILVCLLALLLPYRARVAYMQMLSFLAHLPFKIFGYLARKLLSALGQKNPYDIR